MVLDIVEGQGRGVGTKMAKIHYGVKPDIFKNAHAPYSPESSDVNAAA